MPSKIFDLWSSRGTIGRRRYLVTGLVLFALKHNIDRLLAALYGYEWSLFSYLIFLSARDSVAGLSPRNVTFYGVLVLFALPFIWIGVVLTLRRLRDAGLPLGLVILFFCTTDQPDLLRYSRRGSRKPGRREISASLIANWTTDPRKRIWQCRLRNTNDRAADRGGDRIHDQRPRQLWLGALRRHSVFSRTQLNADLQLSPAAPVG